MARYHINAQGNPGTCKASAGRCPFGGESEHYNSPQEAWDAYEAQMVASTFTSHSKNEPASEQGLNAVTLESLAPQADDTLDELQDRRERADRMARGGDNATFLQASEMSLALDRRITELRGQAQALEFRNAGPQTHPLASSGGAILSGLPQNAYEPALGRETVRPADAASANSAISSFLRRRAA